jgi:hypothetical protein
MLGDSIGPVFTLIGEETVGGHALTAQDHAPVVTALTGHTQHHRDQRGTRAAVPPGFGIRAAGIQHRDRVNGIDIRFSRSGELADAVIGRMVTREREKALVVSSDNAVMDHARRQGATTIPSPDFEEKLAMAAYADLKGASEEENQGWIPSTRKKGPRRRLPKRLRRNNRRLSKL